MTLAAEERSKILMVLPLGRRTAPPNALTGPRSGSRYKAARRSSCSSAVPSAPHGGSVEALALPREAQALQAQVGSHVIGQERFSVLVKLDAAEPPEARAGGDDVSGCAVSGGGADGSNTKASKRPLTLKSSHFGCLLDNRVEGLGGHRFHHALVLSVDLDVGEPSRFVAALRSNGMPPLPREDRAILGIRMSSYPN